MMWQTTASIKYQAEQFKSHHQQIGMLSLINKFHKYFFYFYKFHDENGNKYKAALHQMFLCLKALLLGSSSLM
jgi:hypothetical protein